MKGKIQTTILLITILFCNFSTLLADYYSNGLAESLLMGRHPNARKEAMGKTGVASSGFLYAGLLNPACIEGIEGIKINYSSDPNSHYLVEDKDWNSDYTAIGMKFDNFSFAFDYYRQDRRNIESIDDNGESLGFFNELNSMLGLISSYSLTDNLHLGGALRVVKRDSNSGTSKKGFLLDLGLLQKVNIFSNKDYDYNMNIGASLSNIFNAKIVNDSKENAPVNFRFGLSNNFLIKNEILDRATVNTEIFKILNSHQEGKDDFGFHSGLELNVLKYLLLRCGYYYELLDTPEFSDSKDHLSEFTYGAGVILPVNEMVKSIKIPVEIGFDFAVLEQPSYTESDLNPHTDKKRDNVYNYGFTVKWKFDTMR